MKTLRRLFSLDELRRTLDGVVRRFPFPFAYASVLVVWLILIVNEVCADCSVVHASMCWGLFEGFIISLTATLWCEFLEKRQAIMKVQICILALVVADFIILCMRGGVSGDAEFLGRAAFTAAFVAAVLFLPSVRRFEARQLWNYTIWQLGALAMAVFIGAVMAISCLIIFSSINILFGFDEYKPMATTMCVLALWVPSVVYLSHIPKLGDITSLNMSGFSPVAAFCKNVMLPLVGVYTLILYVYAAKILLTWELPQASVAWMVTGLICASLLMLYGMQRYAFGSVTSFSAVKICSAARRYAPFILLPLLVLMSVGLIYRVGEYGITVSRLYMLAFNVWAYAIVLYLIFKREANLNLVAVSFAIVFALVSMIPGLNFTSIADRVIRSSVVKSLTDKGVDSFPISEERLTDILSGMSRKEAENLASKVEYLDSWDDHSRICDIVSSNEKLSTWRILPRCYDDEAVAVESPFSFILEYTGPVSIPDGYTKVRTKTFYGSQYLNVDSCGFAEVEYDDCSIKINVDSLLAVKQSSAPLVFNTHNEAAEDVCLVFTEFQISNISNDSPLQAVRPQCYIFTR